MPGIVTEPVAWRDTPSPEYIQTLRDLGASERTIALALGIKRRSRFRAWLRRR